MAYNLEKLIIGGFLSFYEEEATVSTALILPASGHSDLGCINEVNFAPETETDTDYCPVASGGYEKIEDERIVKDLIQFVTRDHSEPYWRMLLGTSAALVDAAAQKPFEKSRRHIQGWLKVVGTGDDGVDRITLQIWGRLSIDSNPKWSKDASKPALKFQKIDSTLNTVLPAGIN